MNIKEELSRRGLRFSVNKRESVCFESDFFIMNKEKRGELIDVISKARRELGISAEHTIVPFDYKVLGD